MNRLVSGYNTVTEPFFVDTKKVVSIAKPPFFLPHQAFIIRTSR